jgi:ABC-type amino acid transport substrate-binding protein
MGLWIPIITIVAAATLIFFQLTSWGTRVRAWVQSIVVTTVETGTARLSDFVGLASISLTIVGVLAGWFTVRLQTQKGSVEALIKDYSDQIAKNQTSLELVQNKTTRVVPNIPLHLEAPVRGSSVIGLNANLRWHYSHHSDQVNYLIELVKTDSEAPESPERISHFCDFSIWSTCRFSATNATWESSTVPLKQGQVLQGEYLWRVAPVKSLSVDKTDPLTSEEVWDWSEIDAFSLYPSRSERIIATRDVLIGTSYSVNAKFARIDENGVAAGYDVSFIRLFIEGCLAVEDGVTITLKRSQCTEALKAYNPANSHRTSSCDPPHKSLCAVFISFPTVTSGLAALQRGELDGFVGAVTKSATRETDAIKFSHGYYRVSTQLWGHADEVGERFNKWIARPRRIGVIDKSTNHALASLLVQEEKVHDHISVVAFPSLPNLLAAFTERTVDGVMVDSVVESDLKKLGSDVQIIDGMPEAVWSKFHHQIGAETEELAVAVAVDPNLVPPATFLQSSENLLGRLFSRSDTSHPGTLYTALNQMWDLPETDVVLARLRAAEDIPDASLH